MKIEGKYRNSGIMCTEQGGGECWAGLQKSILRILSDIVSKIWTCDQWANMVRLLNTKF